MNNNEYKKNAVLDEINKKKNLNLCGIQTHKLQFRSPHAKFTELSAGNVNTI